MHSQKLQTCSQIIGENQTLLVSYSSSPDLQREVRVDIAELSRICANNLTEALLSGRNAPPTFAVTPDGLQLLRESFVDERGEGLGEVGLLRIAMTTDRRIDDDLKRHLLYGLLLLQRGGLRLIREDGTIIAPVPETFRVAPVLQGTVSFPEEVGNIASHAPDLTDLCIIKGTCGRPAHQVIDFILHKLANLPPAESLSGSFRLKSFSSVMNKLFYRGKAVKDIMATTVGTDQLLESLETILGSKGAMFKERGDSENGNGCLVYRYVRILDVELEGCPAFTFPIYYEIALSTFTTPQNPHEQYELDRLKYSLLPGDVNSLRQKGFTIEAISAPASLPRSPSSTHETVLVSRPHVSPAQPHSSLTPRALTHPLQTSARRATDGAQVTPSFPSLLSDSHTPPGQGRHSSAIDGVTPTT